MGEPQQGRYGGEASGNPSRMETYAERAETNSGMLEGQVGALGEAWSAFRNALLDSEHASQFYDSHFGGVSSAAADVGDWVVRLKNLDGFVGDVAGEFRRLIGSLANIDPLGDTQDGNWSFNESAVDRDGIRDVDATESIDQAVEDAAELRDLMAEAGIDPEDFDPEQLAEMDPEDPGYLALYEQLTVMFGGTGGELYNEVLFNELGADGIWATLGAVEMYRAHQLDEGYGDQFDDLPDLSVENELLSPFLSAFAGTTGDLDPGIKGELLDVGDDWWKLHQLSLLLGARDNVAQDEVYDPGFLADAASVVLVENNALWAATDEIENSYLPLAWNSFPARPLWVNESLGSPHLTTYEALAGDPEAAWLFADKGTAHLEALLRPDTDMMVDVAGAYGFGSYGAEVGNHDQVEGLVEQAAADTFNAAFVTAVQENPSLYNQALDNYGDVVQIVGEGDIPDPAKLSVASALSVYVADIGDEAKRQREGDSEDYPDDAAKAAEAFNRPDLVDFFAELADSEESAAQVGVALGFWAQQEFQPYLEPDEDWSEEMARDQLFEEHALILGAVMDGFDVAEDEHSSAGDALAAGLKFGGAIVTSVGFAAIPATGGTSLLLTGARPVVSQLVDSGADAIAAQGDTEGIKGNQIGNIVVEDLRRNMAKAIAEANGEPEPQQGEYNDTLNQHFPDRGNPVNDLDMLANVHQDNKDLEDHWSQ